MHKNDIASPFLASTPESAQVLSIENDGVKLAKFSISGESPSTSVEALASEDSSLLHNTTLAPPDHDQENNTENGITTNATPTRKVSRFEIVKTAESFIQDSSNKTKEETSDDFQEEPAASQPLLQTDVMKTATLEREDSSFVIPSDFKERLSHATSMLHQHKPHTHPEPAHCSHSEVYKAILLIYVFKYFQ